MTSSKAKPSKRSALIIIDMLNTFDFPEGPALRASAFPAAKTIAKLKKRFRSHRLPVIYANDNFGRWRSDWNTVYEECLSRDKVTRSIAELLKPDDEDYFVLKKKHSAFFETPLAMLLGDLRVKHLVLVGVAGNICILYTANDAKMRDYEITVVSDATASNTKRENSGAMTHLRHVLKASVVSSRALRL